MATLTCRHCGGFFENVVGRATPGHAKFCGETCAFWAMVKKPVQDDGGCWEWTGILQKKYGRFYWGGKGQAAHRYSWEIAFGEIPQGKWVLHTCDNKPCIRVEHLYLGTVIENTRDACERKLMHYGDAHGLRKHPERAAKGSRHGSAKLTEADVLDIRRIASRGSVTQRQIARDFGVTFQTISVIVSGKSWSHIPYQDDQTAVTSRSFRDWSAAE